MNPDFYKRSRIFKDYLEQNEKLKPFYAEALYPDWQKTARRVYDGFNRTDILKELINQNKSTDDPEVQKNLKLLEKGSTLAVVTGQQLGLMVSPLYIVYKTLTTIIYAKKLNEQVKDFSFVPVFWLEGEDHDYDEVSSVKVPHNNDNTLSFNLQKASGSDGLSMNKVVFSAEIDKLTEQLKNTLQETDFTDSLFEFLTACYTAGENWLSAFKKHMTDLFKGSGLLFFDAGTDKIKQLSKPFFEKIIVENESLISRYESKSLELQKAGYENQVTIQPEKAYLFISHDNGPRLSLLRRDNTFYIRELDKEFSLDQLLVLLDEKPAWFSSTVLTRPLWQSWLLPTVSYVAGAAEIAYWGQLRGAFNHLALPMPQVQPRHSVTLIEPRTKRLLEKYNIDINKIPEEKSRFIKEYFSKNMLQDVNDLFGKFEEQTIESREQVKRLVEEIDPTLISPTEKTYQSVVNNIEKLHNRLVNRLKDKDETTGKHLAAVHESLLPGGVLQERSISAVYFQNKYGPDWVKTLFEKIDANFSEHCIVEL